MAASPAPARRPPPEMHTTSASCYMRATFRFCRARHMILLQHQLIMIIMWQAATVTQSCEWDVPQ